MFLMAAKYGSKFLFERKIALLETPSMLNELFQSSAQRHCELIKQETNFNCQHNIIESLSQYK